MVGTEYYANVTSHSAVVQAMWGTMHAWNLLISSCSQLYELRESYNNCVTDKVQHAIFLCYIHVRGRHQSSTITNRPFETRSFLPIVETLYQSRFRKFYSLRQKVDCTTGVYDPVTSFTISVLFGLFLNVTAVPVIVPLLHVR